MQHCDLHKKVQIKIIFEKDYSHMIILHSRLGIGDKCKLANPVRIVEATRTLGGHSLPLTKELSSLWETRTFGTLV